MNEAEVEFNISKPASAVETFWRGKVKIFSREYSSQELNEKTHGRNTEDRLRLVYLLVLVPAGSLTRWGKPERIYLTGEDELQPLCGYLTLSNKTVNTFFLSFNCIVLYACSDLQIWYTVYSSARRENKVQSYICNWDHLYTTVYSRMIVCFIITHY